MALSNTWSCALVGLKGALVRVEVDIHHGLPATTIVGLPDAAVRESKDRLYAALRNAGFTYPQARITVNLSPADLRKAGPSYDLPIALGILQASEQLPHHLDDSIALGEMALDGSLRPTQGVLPIAQSAAARGFTRILVPLANAAEAALAEDLEVVAAEDIGQLVRCLEGREAAPVVHAPSFAPLAARGGPDLAFVRGQAHARRALEIAAAGGHNLLFNGPPGSGKTMLARCMPSILPPLTREEALEATSVYSIAGVLPAGTPLIRSRPFRSPHHTISNAGLIGGGAWPRPGEVSLAHHGVLFLDELPEFDTAVLEVLRQPLEDRTVTIARAAGSATFPASFTLVAARNPCPCGHHGDPRHGCSCSPAAILRYQHRVSGPLLDRIDMHVEVPRVDTEKLLSKEKAEPSAAVRERVVDARRIQRDRLSLHADRSSAGRVQPGFENGASRADPRSSASLGPLSNGAMDAALIREHCRIDAEGERLLRAGMRQLGLSARAFHRVLKLARTIADMEPAANIAPAHLAEALQYRPRDPI